MSATWAAHSISNRLDSNARIEPLLRQSLVTPVALSLSLLLACMRRDHRQSRISRLDYHPCVDRHVLHPALLSVMVLRGGADSRRLWRDIELSLERSPRA